MLNSRSYIWHPGGISDPLFVYAGRKIADPFEVSFKACDLVSAEMRKADHFKTTLFKIC